MTLGALSALFAMCLLWPLAMPRKRPAEPAQSAPTAAPTAGVQPLPSDLVGDEWCPAGFGVRLRAPSTWNAERSRGRARLSVDPALPLLGSFELASRPNLQGHTLEQRVAEWRAGPGAQPGCKLGAQTSLSVGTREVTRLEYTLAPSGGAARRAVLLLWLSGPQELTLTFSAAEEHWAQVAEIGEQGLASLDFGPRSI